MEFLAETFTDENIVEPIIDHYKSFDYLNYIMGSTFTDGYKLFKAFKNRVKEKQEMLLDGKLWLMYLLELHHGYSGGYEDYKKSRTKKPNGSTRENTLKERTLIDKYKDVDKTKFVQRRL